MLKPIPKTDITVRPFPTYKRWNFKVENEPELWWPLYEPLAVWEEDDYVEGFNYFQFFNETKQIGFDWWHPEFYFFGDNAPAGWDAGILPSDIPWEDAASLVPFDEGDSAYFHMYCFVAGMNEIPDQPAKISSTVSNLWDGGQIDGDFTNIKAWKIEDQDGEEFIFTNSNFGAQYVDMWADIEDSYDNVIQGAGYLMFHYNPWRDSSSTDNPKLPEQEYRDNFIEMMRFAEKATQGQVTQLKIYYQLESDDIPVIQPSVADLPDNPTPPLPSDPATGDFQLEIETTTNSENFRIYTQSFIGARDYNVDWGDGNIDTNITSSTITHNYTTAGIYTITITGQFELNGGSFLGADKLKVKELKNWGDRPWRSLNRFFEGFSNMTVTATGTPNLSETETVRNAFRLCGSITTIPDIENWDMGSGMRVIGTFDGCGFDQSLANWDISKIFGRDGLVTTIKNCGMSTSNYDDTLNGWVNTVYQNGGPYRIFLEADGLTYSSVGKVGRDILVNNFGWRIEGDSLE